VFGEKQPVPALAQYWPNIINARHHCTKRAENFSSSKGQQAGAEHLAVASLLQHGQWLPAAVNG
jgi:hypothetical protein